MKWDKERIYIEKICICVPASSKKKCRQGFCTRERVQGNEADVSYELTLCLNSSFFLFFLSFSHLKLFDFIPKCNYS